MTKLQIPKTEKLRIQALRSLHVLDSEAEKEFDEITALASVICDCEVALISLVDTDRQWFKSKYGLLIDQTAREGSLCTISIEEPESFLIIENIQTNTRFHQDEINVGGEIFLFYAGIPLVDREGYALGTLCVLDPQPKKLNTKQLNSLKSLANQVVMLFELKKKNKDLEKVQEELQEKNKSLKEFARVISHDLKMPLANVITTSDLLKLRLGDLLDEESKEYFGYIKKSSFSMSDYINDILDHYESDSYEQQQKETFSLNDLLKDITNLLSIGPFAVHYPKTDPTIHCNILALKQVFFNLIGNSIKYNDKKKIAITIDFYEDDISYYFKIIDNGMGIPEHLQEEVFDLFSTANVLDRTGNKGNGIGLSTVKKIVENLGGQISVSSTLGESTTFDFFIKK